MVVQSQFIEMTKATSSIKLEDVAKDVFAGGDKPKDYSAVQGELYKYPVFSNGIGDNALLCFSKECRVKEAAITISARGTIGYAECREAGFTPVVRLLTLIPKDGYQLSYLKFALNNVTFHSTGSSQGQLTAPDFCKYEIPNAPKDVQLAFGSIVHQADKSKFDGLKSQFIEQFSGAQIPRYNLSSLCSEFLDGDWIESKDQSDSGYRLVQTGNVGVGEYIDKSGRARYVSEDTFKRLNCTEVFSGDILFSRLPEPLGRCCIIPDDFPKAITAVDCTIARLNGKCLPEFLVVYTSTSLYSSQVDKCITGTTRQRISRNNLAKISVPCPSKEEQIAFVKIVRQADKSKYLS